MNSKTMPRPRCGPKERETDVNHHPASTDRNPRATRLGALPAATLALLALFVALGGSALAIKGKGGPAHAAPTQSIIFDGSPDGERHTLFKARGVTVAGVCRPGANPGVQLELDGKSRHEVSGQAFASQAGDGVSNATTEGRSFVLQPGRRSALGFVDTPLPSGQFNVRRKVFTIMFQTGHRVVQAELVAADGNDGGGTFCRVLGTVTAGGR